MKGSCTIFSILNKPSFKEAVPLLLTINFEKVSRARSNVAAKDIVIHPEAALISNSSGFVPTPRPLSSLGIENSWFK